MFDLENMRGKDAVIFCISSIISPDFISFRSILFNPIGH